MAREGGLLDEENDPLLKLRQTSEESAIQGRIRCPNSPHSLMNLSQPLLIMNL